MPRLHPSPYPLPQGEGARVPNKNAARFRAAFFIQVSDDACYARFAKAEPWRLAMKALAVSTATAASRQ